MKLTEEQVVEFADRFAEYLRTRKKLRRCFSKCSDNSPAYFCRDESDTHDAAVTSLTEYVNAALAALSCQPTLFELDQLGMMQAQERAEKAKASE